MKKTLLFMTVFLSGLSFSFAQSIRITSIVEADCPNTGSSSVAPGVIEMYVDGTLDITDLRIQFQFSFGDFWTATSAIGIGEYSDTYLYFVNDVDAFDREFPGIRTNENTTFGTFLSSVEGGDKIRLVDSSNNNTVIDIFGIDGQNGENEQWNFVNSYVQRNNGAGPNANFTVAEWNLAGKNDLIFDGVCWDEPALNTIISLQSYTSTLEIPEFSSESDKHLFISNPVTAGESFKIVSKTDLKSVELFSLNGVLLKKLRLSGNDQASFRIMDSGIYIIRAKDKLNGDTIIQKLIVE